MRAVILAGGQGVRLRPLTETCPKPMVRLCGRPVLEYLLELLAENGITEAILTLQYLPEQVRSHFLQERFAGVALSFCIEEMPLGTAGSVKMALQGSREALLVICGDALCDFSLRQAIEQHCKGRAAATIVTTQVGDPREYGLVRSDTSGAITGFIEKPTFTQATGGAANTGIYILSPEALDIIPQGKKFDFAADLFPEMLKRGMLLESCKLDGYWCDIGDLDAYRQAQRDLLTGKVRCKLNGVRDRYGNLLAGKRPLGHYKLGAPVYIGKGVQIGEDASITAGSVLEDGCTIAAGATVHAGILLPHCMLGTRSRIDTGILGQGVSVKSHAQLLEGVTVGENTIIGARAVVQPQIRICAGAKITDGAVVSGHITTRGGPVQVFDDDGLCGEVGVELTPELAVRVGCAVGTLAAGRTVGVATGESRSAQVLGDALIAGVRSAGAPVLDFGSIFESMFSFGMEYNALELGVYLSAEASGSIKLVCDAGLPATRKVEREIEQLLARAEFTRAEFGSFGDRLDLSGIGTIYLTALLRLAPEGLSGMAAQVICKKPQVGRLLSNALEKLGCDTASEPCLQLLLSENGLHLSLREGDTILSEQRTIAAYCLTLFEQGQDAAVENDFPRALDFFAQQQGRRVYRYLLCPADGSDYTGRRLAAQQCARDGLMLAVILLDYMRRNQLSLEMLERRLPAFAVEERSVKVDLPPARLLEGLKAEAAGEGLLARTPQGMILLRPRKNGSAIRLFAEAANWETAHELCIDFEKQLGGLLDKAHENR
ncbi:MAG: NTP transferase domain-containing protein [Anaerotruncus sp.]|nr:NTP transferase domain-containing protein [Anaerotruncus sp.]